MWRCRMDGKTILLVEDDKVTDLDRRRQVLTEA